MIPPFTNYKRVFMETTKSEHNHGGAGWEFGTCLWSPIANAVGAKFYEIMKEPKPGDLILHNYHFSPDGKTPKSYLCGFSIVASKVTNRADEPPSPGVWADRGNYYRIDLRDYTALEAPLDFKVFSASYSQGLRDEIEHHHPKFFPFTISGGGGPNEPGNVSYQDQWPIVFPALRCAWC